MRGSSLVLSLALSSGILLPVTSIPVMAAPPSSALSDARARVTQGVLVMVNGDRRYRRPAVHYAVPVVRYYAPRAYAPAYYNPPRPYYPPAAVYLAPSSAYYPAPPVYYVPAPVQVYVIAPPYLPPAYMPPAYYETPAPAYYGYYYDRGYYARSRYDGAYSVRW